LLNVPPRFGIIGQGAVWWLSGRNSRSQL
jgi:hypothetical protein